MHSEETTQQQPTRTRVANPGNPSAEQLISARAAHWHQDGEALLSLEALREWIQRSGLVLFTPKPQLGAPGPSLVEASLGKPGATLELGEMDAAKSLLARLISDGSAVPLNLLGATGGVGTDTPDFVVSAAVFSYIFTLRGNKAWKLAPVTAGAVKVSPLALAAYEILSAKVTLSAYDLTTQLGKEVTEAAVLRALTELWSQLRVLPVPQVDGSGTLWELASGRFTKQIKAGANAGQPSALSALISLYLGQAMIASEDEIESFLSPLAARSRVRDVVHALMSARQLETLVIEGKTLLHVGGELPAFAAIPAEAEADDASAPTAESEAGSGSRIGKFAAKPGSKIGTGLRAKPTFGKKPGFGAKPGGARPGGARPGGARPGGARPGFGARPAYGGAAAGGDRERRPFRRAEGAEGAAGPARTRFDKPWQEDRAARADAGAGTGAGEAGAGEVRPARSFERKPAGDRPGFGRKPGFGKGSFGDRGNAAGASRPPRREFKPREGAAGGAFARDGAGRDRAGRDGEAPRKTFSKPGTFGRKREGFSGNVNAEGRPLRRESGGSGAEGGFKRPGSYSPRPSGPRGDAAGRPSFGAKAGFSRGAGASGGEGGEAPKRVYRKFDAPRSPKPFGGKPASGGRPAFGAKPFDADRPKRTFDGSRAGSAERAERPRSSERAEGRPAFGGKPSGFAGKKPFAKAGGFADKGGPFAKFADGKKPFRKPGAPRKAAGGMAPTRRKREGDGA